MKPHLRGKFAALTSGGILIALSFQNCGQGFQIGNQNSSASSISASTPPSGGGSGSVNNQACPAPTSQIQLSPSNGAIGTVVSITGPDWSTLQRLSLSGINLLPLSTICTTLKALIMPGSASGEIFVTLASGSLDAGNFTITPTGVPSKQLGSRQYRTDTIGSAWFGCALALSSDTLTAIVGGCEDNSMAGAAWIYSRSGAVWTEQTKIVASDASGPALFGTSVALSADGNTALIGGGNDNSGIGAAWVYVRSGTACTEQQKIVATDAKGKAGLGGAVALSADGQTALLAGRQDNANAGAAWVYTRSGTSWTEQAKLTGAFGLGFSAALSADGSTALLGVFSGNQVGSAVVYARSGTSWSQQAPLLAVDSIGNADQGVSVALSADGNTAVVGGDQDNSNIGAAWIFVRSGSVWTQQTKLIAPDAVGSARQGVSVAISADGNTVLVGGYDYSTVGATWIFTRSGIAWTEQKKIAATDAGVGDTQGSAVALTADGSNALVAGLTALPTGAVWFYQ